MSYETARRDSPLQVGATRQRAMVNRSLELHRQTIICRIAAGSADILVEDENG